MEATGFEPATIGFWVQRSPKLSYAPHSIIILGRRQLSLGGVAEGTQNEQRNPESNRGLQLGRLVFYH